MGCLWLTAISGCSRPPDLSTIGELPFEVRDRLEIARNPISKPAARMTLVCTSRSELLLVLMTRIPAPRQLLRLHDTDDASLLVGGPGRELPVKAKLVATGKFDVVASQALSISEARQLATLYGVASPSAVSFMNFQETGIFLRGSVPGEAVNSFSERCWSTNGRAP
jgi:hypothetical protein